MVATLEGDEAALGGGGWGRKRAGTAGLRRDNLALPLWLGCVSLDVPQLEDVRDVPQGMLCATREVEDVPQGMLGTCQRVLTGTPQGGRVELIQAAGTAGCGQGLCACSGGQEGTQEGRQAAG